MQNHRTPAELKSALDAIVAELKALDPAAIPDCRLVDFARTVQDIASYAKVIDARITMRVITEGASIPGAAKKPTVTHRKWHDATAAEQLAQEQFGDAAFDRTLKSPAQIEKLPNGETFVAVAAFKPDAGERVVY